MHICNLIFANNIDHLCGKSHELQDYTDELAASTGSYSMEVIAEKSKVMVNSTNNCSADIHMNGQKLEEVDKFMYLGSALSKDCSSSTAVCTRIHTASAEMARPDREWKSNKISFPTKFRLYRSLMVSILLYGCEAWTLLVDIEKRIQVFESKCLTRLPWILYIKWKTNNYMRNRIHALVGPQECLLVSVKWCKLSWFGHVTHHDSLSKTILQGTHESTHYHGWSRKSWVANIKEWTNVSMAGLLAVAHHR